MPRLRLQHEPGFDHNFGVIILPLCRVKLKTLKQLRDVNGGDTFNEIKARNLDNFAYL
jgi:hypothetical protein